MKVISIIEALQDEDNNLRVCHGWRWLVGDCFGGWIVYERKPYYRKTKIIFTGENEYEAIFHLLN
jgi:hypothetical protein